MPPDASLRLWYQKVVRLAFASLVTLSLVSATACSSRTGDPPSDGGTPAVGGKDQRIRELTDPSLPGHAALPGTTQAVSGAVVIAVDTYDETNDGKNAGGILLQDLDASKERPYGGIGLFAPSFNPGNLKVSPGDVLDLRGQYQENNSIPSKPPILFAPNAFLVQLSQPIATFRYETAVPAPVDIDLADLSDYSKSRRWLGMLVRVTNVTAAGAPYGTGRQSIDIGTRSVKADCNAPFPKVPQIVNDLMDLAPLGVKDNTRISSIVGVVGFFCSMHLAPRSIADIKI